MLWRNPGWSVETSFVGGSAMVLTLDSILDGYPEGDGPWPGYVHRIDHPYGMHTFRGVRGRDVR
jgi:hypothetical protein